ncbi:MAG: hypothetical protein JSW31_04655, partial [Burkholderiales bacterium]
VAPHAAAPAMNDEQQRRAARRGECSRGIHGQSTTVPRNLSGKETTVSTRQPLGVRLLKRRQF